MKNSIFWPKAADLGSVVVCGSVLGDCGEQGESPQLPLAPESPPKFLPES